MNGDEGGRIAGGWGGVEVGGGGGGTIAVLTLGHRVRAKHFHALTLKTKGVENPFFFSFPGLIILTAVFTMVQGSGRTLAG